MCFPNVFFEVHCHTVVKWHIVLRKSSKWICRRQHRNTKPLRSFVHKSYAISRNITYLASMHTSVQYFWSDWTQFSYSVYMHKLLNDRGTRSVYANAYIARWFLGKFSAHAYNAQLFLETCLPIDTFETRWRRQLS